MILRFSGSAKCYPCKGLGTFRQGKRLLENWPRLRERCWIFSSETATAFLSSSEQAYFGDGFFIRLWKHSESQDNGGPMPSSVPVSWIGFGYLFLLWHLYHSEGVQEHECSLGNPRGQLWVQEAERHVSKKRKWEHQSSWRVGENDHNWRMRKSQRLDPATMPSSTQGPCQKKFWTAIANMSNSRLKRCRSRGLLPVEAVVAPNAGQTFPNTKSLEIRISNCWDQNILCWLQLGWALGHMGSHACQQLWQNQPSSFSTDIK